MVNYWAFIGKKLAGPCATREEAIALWHKQFKIAHGQQVGSGYGESNAWFDIRWTSYSYSQVQELRKNFKKPLDV